jgi:hypothetical protein
MEIVLGDEVFGATLSEEAAPKTVAAVLKALPFEGRAVHAQLSGDMFRMFEHAPIPIEETENKQAFQAPGEIVYYPPIQEIAIAYGAARFRGTAGFLYLTPLGTVDEQDLPCLAKMAERLMWDGSKRIQFRAPADSAAGNHDIKAEGAAAASAQKAAAAGRQIEIDVDGVSVTASLLDATAPKTAEALWAALPLRGRVTNTKWSGQMLRFWGGDGELGQVPIRLDAAENGEELHWPGYLYYHPAYRGLRLCYGQAQQSGPATVSRLTPLARLTGDWNPFRAKVSAIMFEGAKTMTIRKKER